MKNFLQFQLWKDCNHNCPFCNAGVKITTPEFKLQQLNFVRKELASGKYNGITRVGIIGGEFFDGQLSTKELKDTFTTILQDLCSRPEIEQVLVASALLYKDNTDIYDILSNVQNRNKIMLCTSWDSKYRFTDRQPQSTWVTNVRYLQDHRLVGSIHVQTILTQHFINQVINNEFNIANFEKAFNVRMDFNAPTVSATQEDKYKMDVLLKDFFPTRKSFLTFLRKVYAENQATPEQLCNYDNMADQLWYDIGTDYTLITGLHGPVDGVTTDQNSPLPSMHEEQSDYIDSHIRMRKDVLDMWERIYG